jgi:hypothetical protein
LGGSSETAEVRHSPGFPFLGAGLKPGLYKTRLSSLLQAAGPKEKEENQYEEAYAAQGIKAPLLAMAPNRKTSHEGYDDKYGQNEHQHVLGLPLCSTPSGLILLRAGILVRLATLTDGFRCLMLIILPSDFVVRRR